MIFFWVLWAFCAIMLAILLYLFFDHIYTTPGGPPRIFFNAAFIILGSLAAILLVSLWLMNKDYLIVAKLLLAVPDLLGVVYLLWLLRIMTWKGRWN